MGPVNHPLLVPWIPSCSTSGSNIVGATPVLVLGTGLGAQRAPQLNWWAHHSACAWAAAWLTVRERRFLGEPEIRHSGEWAERLL